MAASKIWSDPRVAKLFAEPPDRFIAVRNALAAELAAARDRDAAAEVRKARRPTWRLWFLNRLARDHPNDVRQLLEAGAELKREHMAALRGEHSTLRDADEEMSRRLDELVRAAKKAAADVGHAADHALLVGIRAGLRTLATSGDEAIRFRSGTLDHLSAKSGEDFIAELAAGVEGVPSPTAPREQASRGRSTEDANKRKAAAAKREARRAEQAVAAAERDLGRREREAVKAVAVATKLKARAENARRTLEAARERLTAAAGAERTSSQ